MIVYNYTAHLSPPAPFVNVALTCPATGVRIANQPAQMDTGADRTVLPANLVEALGLVEDGRLFFQGFTGSVAELPLFLVVSAFTTCHPSRYEPYSVKPSRTSCSVATFLTPTVSSWMDPI